MPNKSPINPAVKGSLPKSNVRVLAWDSQRQEWFVAVYSAKSASWLSQDRTLPLSSGIVTYWHPLPLEPTS